jgi:hypothetical protein
VENQQNSRAGRFFFWMESKAVSVIAAFPKRPLQLSRLTESGHWKKLAIGLAPVLWLLWLFVYEIRPLWDEYRLHNTGAVARASEVSNVRRYNSRYNHNVDFDLRYVTEDGTSYNTHVEFDSSWVLDEMLLPLAVRYDPSSPGHISTSYGANYLISRTIHVAFWSALPAVWIYFFAWTLLVDIRDGKRSRLKLAAIAAHPTPVQANLTSVRGGKSSVEVFYSWKDPAGRALNGSGIVKRGQSPFWLDTAGTKILALAGPNGESVLLDAALAMADLTERERTRVMIARIEALNLSPGAAGELSNKSIDSVVAKAPEPAPTPEAAAAAATEAAKKDIKGGYWFSVFGGRLADAAAASASGNPGIRALYRFLLISGLASTLIAVGAGVVHDLKSRTQVQAEAQEVVHYEPFNLADGVAPRTSIVELTGLADPTLAIEILGSGSQATTSYIPLLPPHWHAGDPIVYLLRAQGDDLSHSQPLMIRKTGELIRGDLPSEIASEFRKRGINLGAPPIVFETRQTYRDDHLDKYLTAVLCFGIYGFTALFTVASVRFAARSMPKDRGRVS